MPIETEIEPLLTWLQWGLLNWLLVAGTLAVAGVLIGWLVAAVRSGPVSALGITAEALAAGAVDLVRISPRRVWALGWLVVKESIRRPYVLVVFALFGLVLLYAGWFQPPDIREPARHYVGLMLAIPGFLVLLLMVFLSALSLPGDIRNKTLHTVVTKPVRASEVVLGRMLGFTVIGTLLLVVMCPISWVFVIRLLSHTHPLTQADVKEVEKIWSEPVDRDESGGQLKYLTSRDDPHRHELYVRRGFAESRVRELREALKNGNRQEAEQDLLKIGWRKTEDGWLTEGRLKTETTQGHWHEFSYSISADESGNQFQPKIELESGPPKGMLVARVPVYGRLRFTDSEGKPGKGVNVGDEYLYRSFIAGGSLASAIWTFDGITEEKFPKARFPQGLPLELTIEVFRTYKGQTEDPAGIPGVLGALTVCNPETGLKVDARIFEAKDFVTDVQYIPREFGLEDVVDSGRFRPEDVASELQLEGGRLDLFKHLVADGRVEIRLRCAERAQYFGAAQGDVYFKARDASFTVNFAKGYLGTWLQMVLVIGFGVMFSTFLSGPIAILANFGAVLAGMVVDFISRLAGGLIPGGGPFEAAVRLLKQQNVTSPMEPGFATIVIKMLDAVALFLLKLVAAVLPPFGQFSFPDAQGRSRVATGYDIPPDVILKGALAAMAFLLPVFVAGYFFLKTREIAE